MTLHVDCCGAGAVPKRQGFLYDSGASVWCTMDQPDTLNSTSLRALLGVQGLGSSRGRLMLLAMPLPSTVDRNEHHAKLSPATRNASSIPTTGLNNYLQYFGGSLLLLLQYHGPQNPILILKAYILVKSRLAQVSPRKLARMQRQAMASCDISVDLVGYSLYIDTARASG